MYRLVMANIEYVNKYHQKIKKNNAQCTQKEHAPSHRKVPVELKALLQQHNRVGERERENAAQEPS